MLKQKIIPSRVYVVPQDDEITFQLNSLFTHRKRQLVLSSKLRSAKRRNGMR